MLVAIAMLAFFLQRGVGSIIGWVGRSSYVCAAIYFLVSVNSARHQARALRIDLSEAMAEFFRPGQYRALFDNMNDSLAIDELLFDDQGQPCDWRILSVNPAYLKATGKSQAEVIGRRLSEIFGIDRAPEPFLSHFAQVVQTGKPEQVEGYFEPLRMHMQISAFPLGGLRFATLVTDTTARKQAEEALKGAHIKAVSEKNRLEAMMEALPVGVAILDEHGGNIRSNSMFEQVWGGPRPLPSDVSDYAAYKAWWMDTDELVQPEEWASAQCIQKGKAVLGQLMKIQKFDGT
jgi:PAS domain S-box-containing protein